MSPSNLIVRQKYKVLAQLVKRLPEKSQSKSLQELRASFRATIANGESLETRLAKADERISFLRILTPKTKNLNQGGRWIYKDGKRVDLGEATTRDGKRVVSSYDGKNLDPESVKRHNQQLRRAGFVNNTHAKGIF